MVYADVPVSSIIALSGPRDSFRWLGLCCFFRGGKHYINDFIEPRELTRLQDIANLLDRLWIVEAFFQEHQAKQGVNANQADIPRVSRPANLCFEVAGILAADYDQDGGLRFLQLPICDQCATITCDCPEINAVRVGRFDFRDNHVDVRKLPQAIKSDLIPRSPVPTVGHGVAKSLTDLVNNVLQCETASREGFIETLTRIARQMIGRNKAQEFTKLQSARAAI
jgi:hypothetical protein